MTTAEQIDFWLLPQSEHQRLEFKEAKNQFDNTKLFKYCVAIANEGGGHLVLGVSDSKPHRVVGSQAIHSPLEMTSKIFDAVGFRVEIEEVWHADGRVVVLHIPGRPRGTAYNFHGTYLMRVGEELRPMSEDQLRRIFTGDPTDWLALTAKRGVSAAEVVELLDVQTFFELLHVPHPAGRAGVMKRLIAEELVTQEGDGYEISNLAVLLLARNLSDLAGVSRKAARVIVYEGVNKLHAKSDITGAKGYAVGFLGLVQYVMSMLPQAELIETGLRVERTLLPEVVIRELLANALIHQDFEQTGAFPMVEIFPDRIEISNAGEPIVPVERFIDGGQSRNVRLANLMRRFRICEERSSGIDRVVQAVEANQLPAPEFRADLNKTRVILFGPRSFGDMDRTERIRACYQHCALLWVSMRPMTNQSLRERFGLPKRSAASVSQVISAAIQGKFIKLYPDMPKSRRYARYVPIWA